MDFESYVRLIADSVSRCGYDSFMPSLASAADTIELQVLQTEPAPEGDKQVALEWAAQFATAGRVLFCAYRAGNRQIEVVKITGSDVTNKAHIHFGTDGIEEGSQG